MGVSHQIFYSLLPSMSKFEPSRLVDLAREERQIWGGGSCSSQTIEVVGEIVPLDYNIEKVDFLTILQRAGKETISSKKF